MEKLAEYDPDLSFPINIHLIPGVQQSMTIGAAHKLHKELGEILKKIPPVKCIKPPYKETTAAACANCARNCPFSGRLHRGKKNNENTTS